MDGKGARRKGLVFENAVYNYLIGATRHQITKLNRSGFPGDDLELRTPEGHRFSIECKNQRTMALAAWVDQAEEKAPDGAIAVVWHKRAGRTNPGTHYVTMNGDTFLDILDRLGPR